MIDEGAEPHVRDAGPISMAQRVEHRGERDQRRGALSDGIGRNLQTALASEPWNFVAGELEKHFWKERVFMTITWKGGGQVRPDGGVQARRVEIRRAWSGKECLRRAELAQERQWRLACRLAWSYGR